VPLRLRGEFLFRTVQNALERRNTGCHKEMMQDERALHGAVMIDEPQSTTAPAFPRRVWEHWKQAAHAVGVVQTRFFMLIIYAIAVVPTGFMMRFWRDPLHLRAPKHGNWTASPQSERSVDAARRQF
jgi:hypothetical protein